MTTELCDEIRLAVELVRMTPSDLRRLKEENARLTEWKSSVLNALKTFPEFTAGEWGGDKEGWGFCFEIVRWAQRELARRQSDDDLLRTELDAAGVDPCEGQPVTARVRWLMDELERVKGDAARWRFARTIFSFEDIERAAYECRGTWQFKPNEEESLKTDAAVDAEIERNAARNGETTKQ